MSSVVAVSGGTASLGRAIVEAIVALGKYEVIVLSRKENPELEKTLGARIVPVDYSSVSSIVEVLEKNNVDTVVSAIGLGGSAPPDAELPLIHAAEKSSVTKRFIASVFGATYKKEQASFYPASGKILSREELEKTTSLEWTTILNGFFLDYFGMPKVKSYLQPTTLVLDIAHNVAGIPGSGDVPVVFTHSFDVAKYTARLLGLEKWEKESYVIGDKVTWNEFRKLAEEAKGTKFSVEYDSVEKLQGGTITELPSHKYAYDIVPKETLQSLLAYFGIMFEDGQFDFKPEKTLNDAFPDVKPLTVKEILAQGWSS
ncbi:hypothetical protein QQX98_002346 [Neonectria punicea]|uniref:NmrA-like domain-containing protein n=1 Tax=Neonectria punicea TaxID=979145 RepID=A0ABR1HKY8_9HYPO